MFEAVLMGELSRQTGEAAGAAPRVSHHPGSPTRIQGSWDDQPKSWGWGRWGGHFSSLVPQLWCPNQNVPSQWAADQRDEGKHRTEAEDRRQKQAAMEQELKGRAWVCGECVCVCLCVCTSVHLRWHLQFQGWSRDSGDFRYCLNLLCPVPTASKAWVAHAKVGGNLSKNAFDVSPAKCLLGRNIK